MTKLGSKIDKDMVQEFGRNSLHFLNRLVKNQELTHEEEVCAKLFHGKSVRYLLSKFENIKSIIDEAQDFDLDPRASFILMMEEVRA